MVLVGYHNGVMACALIVDVALFLLPLEPERFDPRESWEDPFMGMHSGGGRKVPPTLRRTKLLSNPNNNIPPKLHGTDDRKTQGPRCQSRYPLTSSWPNCWRLLSWE